MTSKKQKLLSGIILFGIMIIFISGAFAQVGGQGSVYDSTVIPAKRMPQQNEFWNNTYNFPAKPRNQWEVGASLGMFDISGDLPATLFTFPNFDIHVRKAFGYVFSLRLEYMNAVGKGMAWTESQNFNKNPAWNTNLPVAQRYFSPQRLNSGQIVYSDANGNNSQTPDVVYYNYKTHMQDLGIQGIVTLNNIRFHKNKSGILIYGGGGIGASWYNTMVNALDANGNNYRALFNKVFAQYGPGSYSDRRAILNALKAGMDNTYETPAQNDGTRRPKIGKNTLKPSGTVLVGVAYKLSDRINIALEDRWTFTKSDLLDGQQWQEQPWGDAVLTGDFDSYNYASIGINYNIGSKSVQPLWWLNPLDYAYDELMNHRHVKIPKMECTDSDGDGVCDYLDREPNTPAGCPVDTHGVSLDTDGDGVPDCRDKEKITPTYCQPVDADGVGKCPDPACCNKVAVVTPPPCPCDYPSLTFGKAATLSQDNKIMLSTIAAKLKEHPDCKIMITGYPETSKASQAVCQKRMEAIALYLKETGGISADRVTTNCQVIKDNNTQKNTVDVKCN